MIHYCADDTADYIVIRSNAQDLMLAYNVPFFNEGDTQAFLTSVARATGRLRKVRLSLHLGSTRNIADASLGQST